MSGTLEFAIHTLVEKRLDMSIFEGKYCNDETWLAENQPKQGAAGREKQSNITDNDSATLMTCHGAVQGYPSPGPS
jgi:hypothetical protein